MRHRGTIDIGNSGVERRRADVDGRACWRDQGKRDEVRELLVPIYGWFTDGFETRDVKEAQALLDELTA